MQKGKKYKTAFKPLRKSIYYVIHIMKNRRRPTKKKNRCKLLAIETTSNHLIELKSSITVMAHLLVA